jgi:UDP-N-acetylglucosamine 1-carboxyvinyltransferase
MHLEGLRKLGAEIEIDEGYIIARAKRLKGTVIVLEKSSVGATGNILMAATLAKGHTSIENAAMEPEIVFLAHFLNKMGARIEGIGTSKLEIEGVDSLGPASDAIIADRIEAGTFMTAAHIVGGNVLVMGIQPDILAIVIDRLRDSGADISREKDGIRVVSDGRVQPVNVTTEVYPGFPTDMQAQWMALMSIARGSSVITESIFKDRFTHVAELQRLGADITVEGSTAMIRGKEHLSGAHVMSTDLRASASLILAGLVAKGRTDISRVYHIDRGYEKIEKKLKDLGAEIWRDQEELVI